MQHVIYNETYESHIMNQQSCAMTIYTLWIKKKVYYLFCGLTIQCLQTVMLFHYLYEHNIRFD